MARLRARFVFAVVALTAVAAAVLTGSAGTALQRAASAAPRPGGLYYGKTAQGLYAALGVSKNGGRIEAFVVRIRLGACPVAGHTVLVKRWVYDFPIRKGRFSRVEQDESRRLTVIGSFTSSKVAKGTVRLLYFERASRACDSGVLTWNAKWKEAAA